MYIKFLECLHKLTTSVSYDINRNVDLSLRLRQVKPSTICLLQFFTGTIEILMTDDFDNKKDRIDDDADDDVMIVGIMVISIRRR